MKLNLLACAVCALIPAGAFAQLTTFYLNDFESGLGDVVDIAPGETARYDIADISVVSSDGGFPGAFPPPSGSNAWRGADGDNNFFGLASGHSSYYVSSEAVGLTAMRISADVYVRSSAAANDNFFALIAVDDTDSPTGLATEQYYRLGVRDSGNPSEGLILQTFNGASFVVVGNDPALTASLASPAWHTYSLEFDFTPTPALGSVNAYVDGVPASFNPVPFSSLPLSHITAGMLCFDNPEQDPMFADNLEMAADIPTVPVELSILTTE